MAGITLEQLKQRRYQHSLSGWDKNLNNLYGASSTTLNQQNRGLADTLDSVVTANNNYLQSGNIGKDILYYYDNYGNYANIDDFISDYNSKIDYINAGWSWGDPAKYNDTGWGLHNQYFKQLYNSRSIEGGDIGYDERLEDYLGSSTWLRNADHYDKAWSDLDATQRTERTHIININGRPYKVGKDQYGHLVKIPLTQEGDDSGTPETKETSTTQLLDITKHKEPEKPIFLWHDWLPLGMQLGNNLIASATKFNNNALKSAPLLQGLHKIHKDTSNYLLRATLENNRNKMLSQASQVASNLSDPTWRATVQQLAFENSLQNTLAQNQEFSKANELNTTGATNTANYNNAVDNEIANANNTTIHALRNSLIENRNTLATEKAAYLNDYIGKLNDSYKEAVKGHRLNLLNIDIETAKFNHLLDLTNRQKKYETDLFNATYNKDNILSLLKHIIEPIGVNGGTTVRDQYYDALTLDDLTLIEATIDNLENGIPLSTKDKEIIDKIVNYDSDYNRQLFSGLAIKKLQLKDEYDLDKLNINLGYKDFLKNLKVLISDQGLDPWRYKKGGKVDTSIVNNAFKNFQKEQDSARKNSVENAKLRLSKLEKELDRIHEKLILLLKQIYK